MSNAYYDLLGNYLELVKETNRLKEQNRQLRILVMESQQERRKKHLTN